MHGAGATKLEGRLGTRVLPGDFGSEGIREPSVGEVLRLGAPQRGLSHDVNSWRVRNLPNLWRGLRTLRSAQRSRSPAFMGFLHLRHIRAAEGDVLNLGLAGCRVVTTAFVNYLVDSLQDAEGNLIDLFRFHGLGTGTTAEAVGDTALVTELTTEYQTDNTRPTGTQVEGASANIYRSVGTITVDAAVAATEHGLFTQAATGGGTLMDRTVFTVVNLANGDSLQATYELTCTAGG